MQTYFTTNLVSKQGGQWQVLSWDDESQEWTQVGKYLETEAEAERAREEAANCYAQS